MAVRSHSTACDDGTFMFPKEFIAHKRNVYIQKKEELFYKNSSLKKVAMTYSPTNICSTIGAVGLNFSVRDGKRWDPNAINRLNIGIRTFDEVQKSVHFFQVVLRKLLSLE